MPGLVFDPQGNRIGFGQGYYDRFFKRAAPESLKCGLAFEFQIEPAIPFHYWDVRMNRIITEEQIIVCPPEEILTVCKSLRPEGLAVYVDGKVTPQELDDLFDEFTRLYL